VYSLRFESRAVTRALSRLPVVDRLRIEAAIEQLQHEPRPPGIIALGAGIYRLRVGRYRVIYAVDDDLAEVAIGEVAPRNERTYRNWQDLF